MWNEKYYPWVGCMKRWKVHCVNIQSNHEGRILDRVNHVQENYEIRILRTIGYDFRRSSGRANKRTPK
jgi:3-dehydroquinate dehydratase